MLSRVSRTVFYFGLFSLPLIFWRGIGDGYEFPKILFFERWVELLILLVVIDFFLSKRVWKLNFFLVIMLLIFFLWNLVTSWLGIDFSRSLLGIYWRWQGLITLLHYSLLAAVVLILKPPVKKVAKVLVASASMECLYLLGLIFAKWAWDIPIYLYLGRAVGTFGNPNYLAGFLAICLPFCFYTRHRIIRTISFGVLLGGIILSASRGTILSVLLAGIIVAIVYLFISNYKKLAFSLGLLLIISSLVAAVFIKLDVNKFNPLESRERIYVRGLLAWVAKPILGYGLENYELAVSKVDYPGKVRPEYEVKTDKAHNEILEILLSSGVVGLIIWLMIITGAIRRMVLNRKFILLSALFIFLIKSQTNVGSFVEYFLFWTLISLSATERSPHRNLFGRDQK